jgi:hypothetical protein
MGRRAFPGSPAGQFRFSADVNSATQESTGCDHDAQCREAATFQCFHSNHSALSVG